MLLNALTNLGLSEKEASVYLMLFRLGLASASSLAKRLGMNRVTVYSVLESLQSKGYVHFRIQGTCRMYLPHDPHIILEDLDRRTEEIKTQLKIAKECVHELNGFKRAKAMDQKSFNIFYGKEAFERLLIEIDTNEEICLIALNLPKEDFIQPILKLFNHKDKKIHFLSSCSLDSNEDTCGYLLVQKNKVMFLSFIEDMELSVQVDSVYAKFLADFFYGVSDGVRTHDLQGHNLAL